MALGVWRFGGLQTRIGIGIGLRNHLVLADGIAVATGIALHGGSNLAGQHHCHEDQQT